MVVDDVENHLDAFGVEGLDHGFELGHLAAAIAGPGVAGVRAEEIGGVVAPIVRETLFSQVLVSEKSMYRHELNSGDAEPLQILNGRFRGQTCVGASQ